MSNDDGHERVTKAHLQSLAQLREKDGQQKFKMLTSPHRYGPRREKTCLQGFQKRFKPACSATERC